MNYRLFIIWLMTECTDFSSSFWCFLLLLLFFYGSWRCSDKGRNTHKMWCYGYICFAFVCLFYSLFLAAAVISEYSCLFCCFSLGLIKFASSFLLPKQLINFLHLVNAATLIPGHLQPWQWWLRELHWDLMLLSYPL